MTNKFFLAHSQRLGAATVGIVALGMWIYEGMLKAGYLPLGGMHREPFDSLSILIWSAGLLVLMSALVWILFGAKVLEIRGDLLVVDFAIFGISLFELSRIAVREIHKPTIEEYRFGYKGKTVVRYRVGLGSGDRERPLLSGLSKEQAEALRGWIQTFLAIEE